MRVLRVINTMGIGGAERSIVNNVPIHNEHGVKTDVLLLNGKSSFFIDKLKKRNIKVYSLTLSDNIKTIYNPLLILKLIKFFKKYDIIHAHLFPSIYWVAIAKVFSFSKTKIVLTEHSTENRRRRGSSLLKYLDRFIYSKYDAIITITPEAKNNLEKHLNTSKRMVIIYNGVDLNAFKKVQEPFVFPKVRFDNPYFLVQVASFRVQKDQKTLIKSLLNLPKNMIAVFVGDGPNKDECIGYAKRIGVYERTLFLGLQEKIPEIMYASDLVIMSSVYEGFGRAAVEGMAAGKPVIGTNVNGLAQVINDKRLLFNVGDDKQLSKIIMWLYDNPELYQNISLKSLENSKRFSLENMIEEYEKVYNRILSKSDNY